MFIEKEDYHYIIDVVADITQNVFAHTIIDEGIREFELSYSEIVKKVLDTHRKVKYFINFDDDFDNIRLLDEVKEEFFARFEDLAIEAIESQKEKWYYYYNPLPIQEE